MADIQAFHAVLPNASHIAEVPYSPHRKLSVEETQALVRENPCSYIRLARSYLESGDLSQQRSEERYRDTATMRERFFEEEYLVEETVPQMFLYETSKDGDSYTGLIASASVSELESGVIRGHENVVGKDVEHRCRMIEVLGMYSTPILMTYSAEPMIDGVLASQKEQAPDFDFLTPDGVTHRVWRIPDSDALVEAFRSVPQLYIADGHHRAQAALVYSERERLRGAQSERNQRFPVALFASNQIGLGSISRSLLCSLPYSDLELLEVLGEEFDVVVSARQAPTSKGQFSMCLGGRWFLLTEHQTTVREADSVIRSLDPQILYDKVLTPYCGIDDPRDYERIQYRGPSTTLSDLEREVLEGSISAAFVLKALTVSECMMVADAKEIMPPKSTWFIPKLHAGLFLHPVR